MQRHVQIRRNPIPRYRETLAVLHHKVDVMKGPRHVGCPGGCHSSLPSMVLRHPRATWDRLAVAGNARLVGLDHRRIARMKASFSGVTEVNDLPALVSLELGEGETARYGKEYLSCAARRNAAEPGERASIDNRQGLQFSCSTWRSSVHRDYRRDCAPRRSRRDSTEARFGGAASRCKAGARAVQGPMPRALTPHGPPAAS